VLASLVNFRASERGMCEGCGVCVLGGEEGEARRGSQARPSDLHPLLPVLLLFCLPREGSESSPELAKRGEGPLG
jgi:hypothetical protein